MQTALPLPFTFVLLGEKSSRAFCLLIYFDYLQSHSHLHCYNCLWLTQTQSLSFIHTEQPQWEGTLSVAQFILWHSRISPDWRNNRASNSESNFHCLCKTAASNSRFLRHSVAKPIWSPLPVHQDTTVITQKTNDASRRVPYMLTNVYIAPSKCNFKKMYLQKKQLFASTDLRYEVIQIWELIGI